MKQQTAKTPTVAIARVLRGLGLVQGKDFRVKGQYQGKGVDRERIGTYVVIYSAAGDQVVADNADRIEELVQQDGGFSFHVSIHFTANGRMWTWVANYGKRTRDTWKGQPTATTGSDAPAEDARKISHETGHRVVRTARGAVQLDTADGGAVQVRIRDGRAQANPLPPLRVAGPARPAFEQPQDDKRQRAANALRSLAGQVTDAVAAATTDHPYDGLAQKRFGALYWACEMADQVWFFQDNHHGARYTLRVYRGRAQARGWYLSGPGLPTEGRHMGNTLTAAAEAAQDVIMEHKWITNRMEETVRAWPKGTRVQGVDSYGVTCMGTVNGSGWGVVTLEGHENYGRTWVDVTWDEMPHNRHTGRRNRPFTGDLIRH